MVVRPLEDFVDASPSSGITQILRTRQEKTGINQHNWAKFDVWKVARHVVLDCGGLCSRVLVNGL